MSRNRLTRAAATLALLAALGGCAIFKGHGGDHKAKTPVLGERIPILAAETGADVDPQVADLQVALPPAEENADWGQPGGNASHSMGHPALGKALARAWSVSIGAKPDKRARLASGPVVAAKRVFTIDTEGTIRAFNTADGATVWEARLVAPENANKAALFGGGVSVDGDRVFATNGLGDVGAFEAATGKAVWRAHPGGPLRGAPSFGLGNIYVVSQDNQLFALSEADGKVQWTSAATLESAGVFGSAAPAVAQGTVVAGFSSGELNAYRYENGRGIWQDALSRTSISTAVASLSDIDADPVIESGTVYAVGQGGRMVALDILSGQRAWELNIAGISTPWVAGDWLFVVTDGAQVMCIARASGKVRWISQLPRWKNMKSKKNSVSWVGPILAGDRLILASSAGELANVDAATGKLLTTTEAGGPVTLAPAVANGTLFILTDDGRLSAWR